MDMIKVVQNEILNLLKEAKYEVWIMVIYTEICLNHEMDLNDFFRIFIYPLIIDKKIQVSRETKDNTPYYIGDYMLRYLPNN